MRNFLLALYLSTIAKCSDSHWNETTTMNWSPAIARSGTSHYAYTTAPQPTTTCSHSTPQYALGNQTFDVVVGAQGNLQFVPEFVEAKIGDVIQFDFLAKNHTLTQSFMQHPCTSNGGFQTGFNQFNPENKSGRFVILYRVSTLKPQWFFCSQYQPKSHCKSGMVFSINPGKRMKDFKAAAQKYSEDKQRGTQALTGGTSKTRTDAITGTQSGPLVTSSTTTTSITSPSLALPTISSIACRNLGTVALPFVMALLLVFF